MQAGIWRTWVHTQKLTNFPKLQAKPLHHVQLSPQSWSQRCLLVLPGIQWHSVRNHSLNCILNPYLPILVAPVYSQASMSFPNSFFQLHLWQHYTAGGVPPSFWCARWKIWDNCCFLQLILWSLVNWTSIVSEVNGFPVFWDSNSSKPGICQFQAHLWHLAALSTKYLRFMSVVPSVQKCHLLNSTWVRWVMQKWLCEFTVMLIPILIWNPLPGGK